MGSFIQLWESKGRGRPPPSPPSAPAAAPNWARSMAGGQKCPSDVPEPARRAPGLLSPLWVEGVLLAMLGEPTNPLPSPNFAPNGKAEE